MPPAHEFASLNACVSFSVAVLLIATGCGGGNSGGSNGSPPPPPPACTVLASNLNLNDSLPTGQSTGFVFTAQPVLDSTNVYWFEFDTTQGNTGGSIRSISKNGGQVMVLASGLSGVNDIELDATNVYWTEFDIMSANGAGAIKTVPKTGGTITVLATGTLPGIGDVSFPVALAVDSTFVYWQCQGLCRVPKTGGTVVELAGSPSGFGLQRMTFDAAGTYLYFNTGANSGQPTTVGRWPPSGGPVQVLASGVGSTVAGGIALDGNFFYGVSTANAPNGNVFEVPIGGGAPIYVVQGLDVPHNVAIDANDIYYSVQPPGAVAKVPKTGGTSTEYQNCSSEPTGIAVVTVTQVAVDDANVYGLGPVRTSSTVGSGGMLVKFPK